MSGPHLTPCIHLLIQRESRNITTPTASAVRMIGVKAAQYMCSRTIPGLALAASMLAPASEETKPAREFPSEIERNQAPMTIPPIRFGASLVIADKPTGDRQSSPQVCTRYRPASQTQLIIPSSFADRIPGSKTRKP